MNQSPFYNATIKNTVTAFGNLFTGIQIVRTGTGAASGVTQTVAVPLSYSNKEKWIQRVQQQPDVDSKAIYDTLPRLAFEMTSLSYDASRKLPRLGTVAGTPNSTFTPVPYNIGFDLFLISKTQEDGLQVIEQILPAFAPEYTVTISAGASGSGNTQEVPIVLNSVASQDTYEGSLNDRRLIVWTLQFTAKINLYGGGYLGHIIKTVEVYINDPAHVAGIPQDYTSGLLPKADYTATESVSGGPITESWIEGF